MDLQYIFRDVTNVSELANLGRLGPIRSQVTPGEPMVGLLQ